MSEFSIRFREIVTQYLQHLQEGGEPIQLKYKPRRHLEGGLVHASSLMDCPLREAQSRRSAPAKFPHLLNINQPTALMRMLQGNKVGEIIQEALVWGDTYDLINIALVEGYIEDDELRIQGQMDAILRFEAHDENWQVIELKHRLPNWKDKTPQPKMGDVFQLLAYITALEGKVDGDEGRLIIINTPMWKEYLNPEAAYEIWSLELDGRGYKLVSEHGHAWQHPLNTGDFINEETLKKEIERQLQYSSNPNYLVPPINLNDSDNAWACRDVRYYPKNGNPGVMTPRCPYWCHTEDVPEEGLKYQVNENNEVEFIYEF